MKPTDHLYRLISCMHKSEKRYFKLYMSKYKKEKSSKAIKLFDYICKTKDNNEKKLKEKISDLKIASQLPYYKNHLYNLLLKSMSDYHFMKGGKMEEYDTLKQIEFLLNKKLYVQALKIVVKAIKKAEKEESFTTLMKLNRYHTFIVHAKTDSQKMKDTRLQIEEKNLKIATQLLNYQEFIFVNTKVVNLIINYNRQRNPALIQELNEIFAMPLLSDASGAKSMVAKGNYYNTHVIYNNLLTNHNEAAVKLGEFKSLLEDNPDFLVSKLSTYTSTCINYIRQLIFAGRFEEAKASLRELELLPEDFKEEINSWQVDFCICWGQVCKLQIFLFSGQLHKIIEEEKYIKETYMMGRFDHMKFPEAQIYYYVILGLFYSDELQRCQEWIIRFLENFGKTDIVVDLQNLIHLVHILVHIELGNTKLVEPLITKFYRYTNNTNTHGNHEQFAYSFLKKYNNSHLTKKEMSDYLKTYNEEFAKDKLKNTQLSVLFAPWLKKQITGNALSSLYLEYLIPYSS